MLLKFGLQYVIRRVQENQEGLNATHELLAYADGDSISGALEINPENK
jgi:hypothetical protein